MAFKDFRDSRTFVSRWVKAKGKSNLQGLSALEEKASLAFIAGKEVKGPSVDTPLTLHPLDDPVLKEHHFFSIYQFFERWAALIDQHDLDNELCTRYMTSYKPWYFSTFILPWYKIESDPYIKRSLGNILTKVFNAPVEA